MATFRKSSSKTRSALETSTALPPLPAEVIAHVGEQAAQLTKSTQKSRPSPAKASRRTEVAIDAAPPAQAADTIHRETPPPQSDDAAAQADPPVGQVAAVSEAAVADAQEMVVEAAEPWVVAAETLASDGSERAATTTAPSLDAADELDAPAMNAIVEPVDAPAKAIADAAEAVAAHAVEGTLSLPRATSDLLRSTQAVVKGTTRPSAVLADFNVKLAELFRDSLVDSLDFFAELTAARSLPEVVTLNSRHFQRRLEIVSEQSRDLTTLAGKLAVQTMAPFTPSAFR